MNELIAGGVPGGNIAVSLGGPPKARASTSLALGHFPYHSSSYGSQELAGFHPPLRAADAEVLPARDKTVARSRQIDRNNGLVNGGVDRRVDAVVGANIWLTATPDFAAIGMSAEWADEWAMQVEAQFRCWANSSRFLCDVERQLQFGGMVRLAYQHYVIDGEAAAPIYYIDDRGGIYATAVLILDPDRISNPDGKTDGKQLDGSDLRGGVELDDYGAARAYWVRNSHPSDVGPGWDRNKWTRVPREGGTGRPLFVHAINKRRAHQHRSIGRLAAVMSRIQSQSLADKTELQAQITNAIFGLYAKTGRSSREMAQSMAPIDDGQGGYTDVERADFYEQADLTFGGVHVAVVPKEDEIATIESTRAGTNFVAFQNYIIRAIASSLGISYEQLSNDWSGINYSSARTLLNEVWRGLLADRHLFTQSFCTPIYAAWLEEAVARDMIKVPGGKAMFYVHRDALTQCQWIGPGRGVIDPKKEADGRKTDRDDYASNLVIDCAEQGRDFRQVLWGAKRVQREMERYGFTPKPAAGNAGGGNDDASEPDDPDAADRAEMRGEEF